MPLGSRARPDRFGAMGDPGTLDLRRSPGAVALVRDVVVVAGPDAVDFLQGQLSQDVAALAVGASAPSFLLQPTGKVDAWLRVTRSAEDEVVLDVDAGWGEAVAARLQRFLLRTKATLEVGELAGLALRGPGSARRADRGGPAPGRGLAGHRRGGRAGTRRRRAGHRRRPARGRVRPRGAAHRVRRARHGRRGHRGDHPRGARPVAGRSVGVVHEGLLHGPGAGGPHRQPGRQGPSADPGPARPGRRRTGPGHGAPRRGAEVGHVTSSASSPAHGAIALAVVARAVEPGTTVAIGDDGATAVVAELPLP